MTASPVRPAPWLPPARRPLRSRVRGPGLGPLLAALALLAVMALPGGRVRAQAPPDGDAPAAEATHPALPAPDWQVLRAPGLRFEYAPQDAALAARLWPRMEADRASVMERLRMFPPAELRVVLAPTVAAWRGLLGGEMPPGTLGVYLLGQHTIVLRSPRTAPGGDWDLRGVLRHELAHGMIDMGIAQSVPLWLHEGLAILVSDELDYLDEAELSTLAVLGRLIPLPDLFDRFPRGHGARTVAYAQAASYVRFLLREGDMAGLQKLLEVLAQDVPVGEAFQSTFGQSLAALERRWQQELAGRFSIVTLITTTSLLGGLGIPLLLLGAARRRLQRRRAYRQWELEERLQAAVRGEPPPAPREPPRDAADGPGNGSGRPLRDGWN